MYVRCKCILLYCPNVSTPKISWIWSCNLLRQNKSYVLFLKFITLVILYYRNLLLVALVLLSLISIWNLKIPHLQQVVVGLPPEVWWPAGAPWNRQGEAGGHLLPLLHWRQPCGTPTNSQPVKGTTNEQPPIKVPNLLHSDMQLKMICQEKRVEGRLLVQHA